MKATIIIRQTFMCPACGNDTGTHVEHFDMGQKPHNCSRCDKAFEVTKIDGEFYIKTVGPTKEDQAGLIDISDLIKLGQGSLKPLVWPPGWRTRTEPKKDE